MKLYKKICALVLLTAVTLTLASCAANKSAVQSKSAQLTISDCTGSIDYASVAQLTLCGCDISSDTVTLNFGGVVTDGRRADDTTVGGSTGGIEGTGYCLKIGDKLYTDGEFQECIIHQAFLEVRMGFTVPEYALVSDESCALMYRDEGEEDYSELLQFSFVYVPDLQSLSGVQTVQSAEGVSVAASATALGGGYTYIKLYSESTNGLGLASYGIGGRIAGIPGSHLGLLGSGKMLCLRTEAETLTAQGLKNPWYYPSGFVFKTGEQTEFTLDVPYVVFHSGETWSSTYQFDYKNIDGINRWENYVDGYPLKYGTLNLEVKENSAGFYQLYASVERSDENLRVCGVDLSINGKEFGLTFGEIADSESSVPVHCDENEIKADGKVDIIISDVYYAQVVNLEIPLTTN